MEATRQEEFGEEFRLSSIRLQLAGANCAQPVELLGGDFVDLHPRLIQCFAHWYRIVDPDQDRKTPVTLALSVVPAGHLSMQCLGQIQCKSTRLALVCDASGAATVAAGLVVGEWRKRVREHGFRGWVRAPRCRPDAVRWSAGRPNAGVDGCDQAIPVRGKAFPTASYRRPICQSESSMDSKGDDLGLASSYSRAG